MTTIALHRTEVDGVPAVWAPAPGPLHAGLILRMGSADETLPTSGVSHALEHLALFGVSRPGDHSNGFVDQTMTMVHVTGEADEVVRFFDQVTRQLAVPRVDRLADELGILRSEEANRQTGVEQALLAWRYGAQGYGLVSQEALGLYRLDADTVRAWSARFATRGNAALWLSGEPPAGLRLHLPAGTCQPPPDPHAGILPRYPAWFTGSPTGVALHALLPRDEASVALADVLRSRLVDELRVRRAAAYSPDTDYKPLTGRTARLVAASDLVRGKESEGVRPVLRMLERLADVGGPRGVTDADVAEWRTRTSQQDADPMLPATIALSTACRLAFGVPVIPPEELRARREAVTPEEVASRARAAFASVLARVPPRGGTVLPPWSEAPLTRLEPVSGTEYVSEDHPVVTERLVLGPEGITLRDTGGDHLTVPVARTAAVLHWADGRRVLVGTDANRVDVEPTLWRNGRELIARIDGSWPAELTVDLGERAAERIPRRRTSRWRRIRARVTSIR